MKTVNEYIQEKIKGDILENSSKELREKIYIIKQEIDGKIFSFDIIDLLFKSDEIASAVVKYSALFLAISVPGTKKMRKDSIIEVLKRQTHFHLGNYSEEEYIDLLSKIAEEIMDCSIIMGNENKYSKSEKIIISLGKKTLKTVFKPVVNVFKAPANVLMMKWIVVGIRQALIIYLVNRDILGNTHKVAIEEARKGYEEILSYKLFDEILIL